MLHDDTFYQRRSKIVLAQHGPTFQLHRLTSRKLNMPSQGFGIYVQLLKSGHSSKQMGLKGTESDVARWNARFRLARSFRGLDVESYSDLTTKGYSAFFQVFLTHSALERYVEIIGMSIDELEPLLQPHDPEKTIKEFFNYDKKGKLFDFLHGKLKSQMKTKLTACRDGACHNVGSISASVRHIFVHGHLTPNSRDMNPNHLASACGAVSEFLLDFMECDFTARVAQYARSLKARS
jgi:hypothetical protein